MLIDWFTVSAQALNFIVLVWLMKRFLYGPILRAIEARDRRVAAILAEAEQKALEATKDRDEFQLKNQSFEREREALLTRAKIDADAEGKVLLAAARRAADAMSNRRAQAMQNEAESFGEALSTRARQEVFAVARKTLADLATIDLEQAIGEAFLHRLRALDDAARAELMQAIGSAKEPVLVRSTFDLPAESRAQIKSTLEGMLSAPVDLDFKTSSKLVSGVELTVNGLKVAWSIAEYLRSLEKGVVELIPAPVAGSAASEAPSAPATTRNEPPAPGTQPHGD